MNFIKKKLFNIFLSIFYYDTKENYTCQRLGCVEIFDLHIFRGNFCTTHANELRIIRQNIVEYKNKKLDLELQFRIEENSIRKFTDHGHLRRIDSLNNQVLKNRELHKNSKNKKLNKYGPCHIENCDMVQGLTPVYGGIFCHKHKSIIHNIRLKYRNARNNGCTEMMKIYEKEENNLRTS